MISEKFRRSFTDCGKWFKEEFHEELEETNDCDFIEIWEFWKLTWKKWIWEISTIFHLFPNRWLFLSLLELVLHFSRINFLWWYLSSINILRNFVKNSPLSSKKSIKKFIVGKNCVEACQFILSITWAGSMEGGAWAGGRLMEECRVFCWRGEAVNSWSLFWPLRVFWTTKGLIPLSALWK